MAVIWEKSGDAFYADVEAADGSHIHMSVEELPRAAGWEWLVWHQRNGMRVMGHGVAGTAQDAMQAAEAAAGP
jgi:hypothetical protein